MYRLHPARVIQNFVCREADSFQWLTGGNFIEAAYIVLLIFHFNLFFGFVTRPVDRFFSKTKTNIETKQNVHFSLCKQYARTCNLTNKYNQMIKKWKYRQLHLNNFDQFNFNSIQSLKPCSMVHGVQRINMIDAWKMVRGSYMNQCIYSYIEIHYMSARTAHWLLRKG